MYTQLLPRVLLGGYDNVKFDVNILDRANVSHVINLRNTPLPELVAEQFIVLDASKGEYDHLQVEEYWADLMNMLALIYQQSKSIMYFHAKPNGEFGTPMAVYAGLRALGYTTIQSRRLIYNAHPVTIWYDLGMRRIDSAYENWCREMGKNPEEKRQNMLRSLKENSIKLHEVADVPSTDLYTD